MSERQFNYPQRNYFHFVPLDSDRTQSPSIKNDMGRWSQLAIAEVQAKLMTNEQREAIRRIALKLLRKP